MSNQGWDAYSQPWQVPKATWVCPPSHPYFRIFISETESETPDPPWDAALMARVSPRGVWLPRNFVSLAIKICYCYQ